LRLASHLTERDRWIAKDCFEFRVANHRPPRRPRHRHQAGAARPTGRARPRPPRKDRPATRLPHRPPLAQRAPARRDRRGTRQPRRDPSLRHRAIRHRLRGGTDDAANARSGRVHWREQTFPGIHEPLTDQDTFDRAQALLKERGEDWSRASNRADFLLSGLVHCGRCRRAYVGMSAKGNGGTYHYYACSGRQKLGRKGCDGERLPKDKLETANLEQLTGLYRHGGLIRDAIEQAAANSETDRAQLTEQRASLAKEITRAERAIERYQDAFENGDLDPARFKEGLSALDTRLDALQAQDQATRTRTRRRGAHNARHEGAPRRRRPARPRHRPRRHRPNQGAATHPHRRPARQQPPRNPAHRPRRRTRGLRTDKFSGRNLAVCANHVSMAAPAVGIG
jgi:Recombinase zinc beta ribbon domain